MVVPVPCLRVVVTLVVVAVLSGWSGNAGAGPIRVAVERSPSSPGSHQGAVKVASQLNDSFVFDFDAVIVSGTEIDTLVELAAYDVVVIGDGGDVGLDDLATFAPALRSWVESGGGLVSTGWLIWEAGVVTGTPVPDIDAIVPVNTSGPFGFLQNAIVELTDPDHPVTRNAGFFGISGCCLEFPAGAPAVDPGATVIGISQGRPVIVVGEPGLGRSVYLGPTYMGNDGYSTSPYTGFGDQVMEQAVFWVSRACGNGSLDAGEECDAGAANGAAGSCCTSLCSIVPSGESCDDLDACTQVDTCDGAGACVGSDPVVCTALDQCHDAGTCDPGTGACDDPAKPDGSACDDGEVCTTGDTCQAGACSAGSPTLLSPLDDLDQTVACVEETVGLLP